MGFGGSIVPIKIEVDPTESETTSYGGLLPYLDLWNRLEMPAAVDDRLRVCGEQGWLDRQMVLSLVLLNLSGGDCVTDIDKLDSDSGLCRMVSQSEFSGLSRADRRAASRRFRRGRTRTFPAATQIYSWLESFHEAAEEAKRIPNKAFIPAACAGLAALRGLNAALIGKLNKLIPANTATLDCDATLVPSDTKEALFCYKGFRGYQPYNVWWAEQQVVLHSEFRDGNVPAGYDLVRVLSEALTYLPDSVERVFMRQDTAAYDVNVLAWCEREREHPQYGRIEFTISADITQELRAEILKVGPENWTREYRTKPSGERVKTGREWAEIVFVPNTHAALSDIKEPFRYIAIRERLGDQLSLLDVSQPCLPFPMFVMDSVGYKVHAIVSNRRTEDAEELIRWHFGRCGKSEEAHSMMKSDFAGGQMPSAKFGANAAWWALMILSLNFQAIMRRTVLGERWRNRRMKAVRFGLINTAGRIVHHSRQYCLRVGEDFYSWLASLRESIRALGIRALGIRALEPGAA